MESLEVLSYPDELDVVVIGALGRAVVQAAGRELVLGRGDDLRVVEVPEDRHEAATVPVVCDSTPVVALPRHVGDGVVGNFVVLVNEHLMKAMEVSELSGQKDHTSVMK